MATKQWHSKTSSKNKGMRLMPGAMHETTKEPNNHIAFEAALKFMGDQIIGVKGAPPAKAFGWYNHKLTKYYKNRSILTRKRFWIFLLIVAYFTIGFIIAIIRRKKRMLFTWPKMLKK